MVCFSSRSTLFGGSKNWRRSYAVRGKNASKRGSVRGLLTASTATGQLLFLPVLEAAFRFRFSMLLGVIAASDFACFFWQWRFFVKHPPIDVGEYIEAGTTSLMLAVVGVLVWLLVRDLRRKETRLADNLRELEQAREKLLHEEKLAAIGRLSSAIAHEIRNPVAMIASSIATAKQLSGAEREEMFVIASDEAGRLTRLTTEFLDYASARRPNATTAP